MGNGVILRRTSVEGGSRREESPRLGLGALLFLTGSALTFSESSALGSSIGSPLGFLLLLMGLGLISDRPRGDRPAP